MTKTYKYVGDGAGVPGLPHVVTEDEAKMLGVEELLKQAVAVGVYQEVKPMKPATGPKEGE